jgi:hypothetical protein
MTTAIDKTRIGTRCRTVTSGKKVIGLVSDFRYYNNRPYWAGRRASEQLSSRRLGATSLTGVRFSALTPAPRKNEAAVGGGNGEFSSVRLKFL